MHFVRQTPGRGGFRIDAGGTLHQIGRPLHRHARAQNIGHHVGRDKAQIQFAQFEIRGFRGDNDVAGGGQAHSAGLHRPLNEGGHGFRGGVQGFQQGGIGLNPGAEARRAGLMPLGGRPSRPRPRIIEAALSRAAPRPCPRPREGLQIHTQAEHRPVGAQENEAHRFVGQQKTQTLPKTADQLRVQAVSPGGIGHRDNARPRIDAGFYGQGCFSSIRNGERILQSSRD